jgi:hypothetical protein
MFSARANKNVISQFGYHDYAPVKGGAAVAQRPMALDGEMRIHSMLCFLPPNPKLDVIHNERLFSTLKIAVMRYEPITWMCMGAA